MNAPLFSDLVINGETVPQQLIAAEAQNHPAPKSKPGMAWRKAAEALAIRTLLLQEAVRRGIPPAQQEVAPGRLETKEEALIRGLLDTVVETDPPDEDAIRAEWARVPDRFRTPPLWEASHILCACNPEDEVDNRNALDRASALIGEVLFNPRRFAAIAMRESDCGSKDAGGSLGQIRPGDMTPEFEAVLRTLSPEEVTAEPILTRHGWHVVRLDAVSEGQPLPFEAVRQKIADALEKAAWAREAHAFVGQLVQNASISGVDLR